MNFIRYRVEDEDGTFLDEFTTNAPDFAEEHPMKRVAYVITRTDDDREEDRRVMSLGTQLLADDQDPAAYAADRLAQNRVEHSYYTGPRRISYWPHPDGTPLPRTAPANAQHIDG